MQLKQAIREINGFGYVVNLLNVLSSVGRKHLHALPFLTSGKDIEAALAETEKVCAIVNSGKNGKPLSILSVKLTQLKDISGALKILSDNNVLNDIALFEIKHFALLSESIRECAAQMEIPFIDIPGLTKVIDILDPEKKRIPHFYICDAYSPALASLRAQLNKMEENGYREKETGAGRFGEETETGRFGEETETGRLKKENTGGRFEKETGANEFEKEIEEVRFKAQQLEDTIRKGISQALGLHVEILSKAIHEIARLDVLLSKSYQINELGLNKPSINDKETSYTGLFHPEIRSIVQQQHKTFQPVNISIPLHPTVITGANMAGKSVLLKSVALAQSMAQFGFYVPAQSAMIVPVDTIVTNEGDGEDQRKGLSSFASEMVRLNAVADNTHRNIKQLVLIDELARTTNPAEGKAIVCGMLDFLIRHNVQSLVTTHYSIDMPCRKLRVKGFTENKNNEKITIGNINAYIDYSLEETTEKEVPHEAVKIAEIIGVDRDIIDLIKNYL